MQPSYKARQAKKLNKVQMFRVKPCKLCGLTGHTAMSCYLNRRAKLVTKTKMRTIGKVGREWLKVRAEWFRANPAEFYFCYICGDKLTPKETTLDHVKSRSRHPELRYDLNNLQPCCYRCNRNKGSRDLEEI